MMSCPNIPEWEDPLVLLKFLSGIRREFQFVADPPSLHPQNTPKNLTHLFLDTVASTVVNRPGQSAAVAASFHKRGGRHTTLYLAFCCTPTPCVQSHLQALLSLLRDATDIDSDGLAKALSRHMYEFSWNQWVHNLGKILRHLDTLKDVAQTVTPGLIKSFDELRRLGDIVHNKGIEDPVGMVMEIVAQLDRGWIENRFFVGLGRGAGDSFQHLAYVAHAFLGEGLHFAQWISKLISVHRRSAAWTRLAKSPPTSKIFRGTFEFVILSQPFSPPPTVLAPLMDVETISSIVSHVREAVGDKVQVGVEEPSHVYRWTSLRDPMYDEQVCGFTAWTANKFKESGAETPAMIEPQNHGHCERHLLLHIHENHLPIYPYFGTSSSTCGNCSDFIGAYLNVKADSPLIEFGRSNGIYYAETELPEFKGDFGPRYRKGLVALLQRKIAQSIVNRMNYEARSGKRVRSFNQYVGEATYY